jgi:manganese transport protein
MECARCPYRRVRREGEFALTLQHSLCYIAGMSADPTSPSTGAWPQPTGDGPSLGDMHASVAVPSGGHWWFRLFAFLGPGYMVSVGYMDPGNWATDLAGGARFGYTLLFGHPAVEPDGDPAAGAGGAARHRHRPRPRTGLPRPLSRPVNFVLWMLCEIAIIACDLAEVIGTAIALQLLFGIPLIGGASSPRSTPSWCCC